MQSCMIIGTLIILSNLYNKMDFSYIVGVIQVRTGSTRLKQKCFRNLGGMTMLDRVILQVQGSTMIDSIVISTSDSEEDDEIFDFATRKGIICTRGPLDDIVQRLFLAKTASNAGILVRLWGDCPFICPHVIDKCIIQHISTESDFTLTKTSSLTDLTYPPGQDLEVYNASTVENLHCKLDEDSEFRTFPRIAMYRDEEASTKIEEVRPEIVMPGSYLAVDYEEDLISAERLIAYIDEPQRPILLEEIVDIQETNQDTDPCRAKLGRNIEYNNLIAQLTYEERSDG